MHNVLSKNMPRFLTNEALITIVPSNAAWPNEPKLDRYQLWKALYNDCSIRPDLMSVMSLNIAQMHILHHAGMLCKYRYFYYTYLSI
jgi:hypothetical protein